MAATQPNTHLFRTALPQQWYRLAAIQNAGLALDWVRGVLGLSWEQVYAEAFTVAAGSEGLTFLPYLTGDRTPHLDPHVRGAWLGLSLHHTRAHLMRAALEGVAFSIRQGLEALMAACLSAPAVQAAHLPNSLRLAGGGTLHPQWRQLLADVLQLPLHSVHVPAASARGAALLAGLGIHHFSHPANLPSLENSGPDVALTPPMPASAALKEAWKRFVVLADRQAGGSR